MRFKHSNIVYYQTIESNSNIPLQQINSLVTLYSRVYGLGNRWSPACYLYFKHWFSVFAWVNDGPRETTAFTCYINWTVGVPSKLTPLKLCLSVRWRTPPVYFTIIAIASIRFKFTKTTGFNHSRRCTIISFLFYYSFCISHLVQWIEWQKKKRSFCKIYVDIVARIAFYIYHLC